MCFIFKCGIKYCILSISIQCTLALTLYTFYHGCNVLHDIKLALVLLLVILNIATMILFWLDKCCAVIGCFRIPEIVLQYMILYGSPIGALFGLYCPCCPHKSKKRSFMAITRFLLFFNLGWYILFLLATNSSSSICFHFNPLHIF